jgi:hypothetical protein
VTGYDVFRATNNGPFVSVATTVATSFNDRLTGLFQYQVRARDAAGNTSAFTAPSSALPPPCPTSPPPDTVPPTTPGTPTATVSCGSATLTWTASSDNVRVVGYEIWQASGTDGRHVRADRHDHDDLVHAAGRGGFPVPDPSPGRGRQHVAVHAAHHGHDPGLPGLDTPPPTAGCGAVFSVVNSWPGAFQGQVAVTNTGATPTTGWTVTLTFPTVR